MSVCPIPELPGPRGTRADRVGMVRPMREAWHPRRLRWPSWVGADLARRQRIVDMTDLVMWLDVERSARWMPHRSERTGKLATYCDHYVADWYSQWIGRGTPTLPPLSSWLWWRKGCDVAPVYGDTVVEHGATSTYDWLLEYAKLYGWVRHQDEPSLRAWMQHHSNPGLVIARTAGRGASHVAVALPDDVALAAQARGVTVPEDGDGILGSEAGGRCRMLTRRAWWRGRSWAGVQYLGWPG